MTEIKPGQELPGSPGLLFSLNRLEALIDAIFGFAMTLLVINLTIPKGTESSELGRILAGQLDNFYAYIISFLLLSRFWVAHHRQFHYIKRTDNTHIWINVIMLLFVALMPFSTSIISDYSNTLSGLFFGGNMLALGLLFMGNWVYATRGCRLVDPDLDRKIIRASFRRSLVPPVVAAIAMIVSVFSPEVSSYIYLLIFIVAMPVFR